MTETLKGMTLEEKIGQVIFTVYHGAFVSAESDAYRNLLREVEQNHVGGFIVVTQGSPLGVVKSQVYPTAVLANQLQSHAKIPLLIGADFERGTAMRLDEGTSFPPAMGVAATWSPVDAYQMGKITALEARASGVHWVFAPVADVNSNPDNPIINTRSFGEDPKRVAEFVSAYVRGVEENGALATAKHFPGHGDAATDSHLDLPVIQGNMKRLEEVELVPFRAAVKAGVSSIMTAHLSVPAFEPDPNVPATLSHNILTNVLRQELGFEGLVVTDAMEMGGITVRYPPGEAAVRAFLAGSDAVLMPPVPDAAFAALLAAARSGRISKARLDQSVTRLLRAKARLGLPTKKLVDVNALNSNFGKPAWVDLAQNISDRGVVLLRDTAHLLPLDATRPTRALLVAVDADPDPYPAEDLERELRWRVDSLQVVRTDSQFSTVSSVQVPSADKYDVSIVALFVKVSDRKGTVGVREEEAALINRILRAGKPAIVVCFGNPYLIGHFPDAATWLAAMGTAEVSQISAARALFGQTAIGGRLPVSVPGVAGGHTGDGIRAPASPMTIRMATKSTEERLKPAFDMIARAVVDHAFPGGVLAVGYRGEVTIQAFGKQTYEPGAPAIRADTIYDVASLSKVIVTTTVIARLTEAHQGGRVDLDAPIARYLPEWASGPNPEWRRAVTVRHLLTHTSGLPPHQPFYKTCKSKDEVVAKIMVEPLVTAPGAKEAYSDLGVILLGEIAERVTGRSLETLARQEIFTPLGMRDTMYNPPKRLLSRIAPTENDSDYRKRLVHGVVHDENAFAMGGVAGHAGVFSTASDLSAFCQMLLNGGIYAHHRFLRRSTLNEFTGAQSISGGTRVLGWAVPTEGSSAGHYFSKNSFGHTGFTGTSIWIDPQKELFVILLTNRVHPTRENNKIREVRPAVADAVVESLGLAKGVAEK
ncbi:MAG TPA: glycoside hydrolase family 3 N-terminal domain-containing protein [Candidatus Dormibacteraeota bacterium]|nr:glycoside hydrolase family 3 N-terminal domain-containing protein [Candidatus Dormibacteraeota bacterium]